MPSGPTNNFTETRGVLGDVVAGCVLREVAIAGPGRHHHYTGVLRDQIGNLWECYDHHTRQDQACECAALELARRVETGEVIGRRLRNQGR